MKKSNALMISYMVFLLVSMLAQIFFDWDGLEKIAIAATVAGCFFAFGDLSNWYISHQKNLIDVLQKDFDNLIKFRKTVLNAFCVREKELSKTISLIEEYKDSLSNGDEILKNFHILENFKEVCKKQVQKPPKDLEEYQELIDGKLKTINIVKKTEIIMFSLGFFVFFSVISFQFVLNIFNPIQTIFTVIAFLVIMLNYYLRDVLEEKSQKYINDVLGRIQSEKEEIQLIEEESRKTPVLDKVNELIEKIEFIKSNQR